MDNNQTSEFNVSEKTTAFKLSNINLDIMPRKLTCIIGKLGSGKSSLLYALAGEMKLDQNSELSSTRVVRNGKSMFISQRPWMISDTVERNIVIEGETDEQQLNNAINLAQLQEDLNTMPLGINSIVSESGKNLSSGQRARICLARCFYHKSDIYLLDDPLSALDMQLSDRIMKSAICDYLGGTTRVLVTNSLQHLKYADDIVLIDEGRIIFKGSFEDIQTQSVYREISQVTEVIDQLNYKENMAIVANTTLDENSETIIEEKARAQTLIELTLTHNEFPPTDMLNVVVEEDREKGRLSFNVVHRTIQAFGGYAAFMTVLVASLVNSSLLQLTDFYMLKWIQDYNPDNRVGIFWFVSSLMYGRAVGFSARVLFVVLTTYIASKRIHSKMAFALLHSKIAE